MRSLLKPRSLTNNMSWALVGNLAMVSSQWGIISVLAKLGNLELVGQYAFALAVTSPIFLFANLELRSILATDVKETYHLFDYFMLRGLGVLAACVAILILLMSVNYDTHLVLIILMLGCAKAVTALMDIGYGYLQRHERMDEISKSQALHGTVALLLFVISMFVFRSLVVAIASTVLAASLAAVMTLRSVREISLQLDTSRSSSQRVWTKQLVTRFHSHRCRDLLVNAIPLGLASMLLSLNLLMPRYFLEWYWSTADLGVFAAVSYVLVAGKMLAVAIGQAATPRLAKLAASGSLDEYSHLVMTLALVAAGAGAVLTIGAYLIGDLALEILYTAEYAKHRDLLVYLCLGTMLAFAGTILDVAALATRRFTIQLRVNLARIVVLIGLSALLIPHYGLTGAAIVVISGNAVHIVIMARYLHNFVQGGKAAIVGAQRTVLK